MTVVPYFGDIDLSQVPEGWTWITPHYTPKRPGKISWQVHMGYIAWERNRILMEHHLPGTEGSQLSKYGDYSHIKEDTVSITLVSVLRFDGGPYESCPGTIGAVYTPDPREYEEVGVPVWGY